MLQCHLQQWELRLCNCMAEGHIHFEFMVKFITEHSICIQVTVKTDNLHNLCNWLWIRHMRARYAANVILFYLIKTTLSEKITHLLQHLNITWGRILDYIKKNKRRMKNVLSPLSAYPTTETEMTMERDTKYQLWTILQWFFKIQLESLLFIEISKFIHEMRKPHWLTWIFFAQILIQWHELFLFSFRRTWLATNDGR